MVVITNGVLLHKNFLQALLVVFFQSHNIQFGMDLHIIQTLSLLTNKNIKVYRNVMSFPNY